MVEESFDDKNIVLNLYQYNLQVLGTLLIHHYLDQTLGPKELNFTLGDTTHH